MDNLKEIIRSIINSFLGPNKSNKFLIQDKDVCFTRCPLYILQNNHLLDSTSLLVEETLFAHHELYGCSTLSLLAMWYFWKEEFRIALEDGCDMQSIVKHSQNILEVAISAISDVALNIDEMLQLKKPCPKVDACQIPSRNKNDFNQMPVSIRYSSRHFSPSQSFCGQDSKVDEKCLRTVIQSLDHDEDIKISELILECWNKQVISTGCRKFLGDGILIFPIALPHCSSTVVDGLLVKSNLNHSRHQELKNGDTNRALIIMGSVTYQFVHLGFAPKVSKISDQNYVLKKEEWRKMCCNLILQHKINILLVREDIEQEIASFCSVHDVLVFSHIPPKVFKILCNALQHSPCTYLCDCTEENIIKNLTIGKWEFNNHPDISEQYFLFNMNSATTLPLQTIVLSHPVPAVLEMLQHQIQHLISRLSLCFKSGRLLMGGGEAEMWCAAFLKKHSQFQKQSDQRTVIMAALTSGYQNYGTLIGQKMALANTTTKKTDEMLSKVNAWRSALSLVLLTLQCNTAIVNGFDGNLKIGEYT